MTAGQSIKIPGNRYDKIPIIAQSDKELIEKAKELNFDYIAVPGVQTGKDVMDVRDSFGGNAKMHIVAKIDCLEAI